MKSRILLLVLTIALTCNVLEGKKFPLTAAASVPAARGQVETGKDKNGNTEVKLEAEHLTRESYPIQNCLSCVVSGEGRGAHDAGSTAGRQEVKRNLSNGHAPEKLRCVRDSRI